MDVNVLKPRKIAFSDESPSSSSGICLVQSYFRWKGEINFVSITFYSNMEYIVVLIQSLKEFFLYPECKIMMSEEK